MNKKAHAYTSTCICKKKSTCTCTLENQSLSSLIKCLSLKQSREKALNLCSFGAYLKLHVNSPFKASLPMPTSMFGHAHLYIHI